MAPNGHTSSSKNQMSAKQVEQEKAVGIEVYASPNAPGFRCTVKHRYTDFLVNEILPDGSVLHLRSVASADSGRGQKRTREQSAGQDDAHATTEPFMSQDKVQDAGNLEEADPPHKKQRTEETVDAAPASTSVGLASAAHADDEATNQERKQQIIDAVPRSDRTTLQAIFGDSVMLQILDLNAETVIHPTRRPKAHPSIMSSPVPEKAQRTEAHVVIRRMFEGRLETATVTDQQNTISIKAAPVKAPTGARAKPSGDGAIPKGKIGWGELGGEYLHFTLYKENKDTMEVLGFIASQLKMRVNSFQFAGTKDRRGVTTQRVATFRIRAEQVVRLNKMARGFRVGDFAYEKHGLDLGDSGGNEFSLTLRDCHFEGEEGLNIQQRLDLAQKAVSQATQSFREYGFLNYYGLQRFGTHRTGTHAVGQKMLQGDLQAAIDCILAYDPNVLPEVQEADSLRKVPQDDIARADAIRTWRKTGQTGDKVKNMPRRFQAESNIIQYLSKKDRKTGRLMQDQDWQGALTTIQRNLRLMYVHAYQSFVWNTMAGKRWELFGKKVIEGDLVIVGETDGAVAEKAQVDEAGEPVFHPAAHDSAQDAEDAYTRARSLSQAEVEGGKYTVHDIVLPLPGYDVEYPPNAIGKLYGDFMASDAGGGLDPHNMRRAWKDLSLSGAYRKIMSKPGVGFEYELRTYFDDLEQMVETDLERLEKAARPANGSNGHEQSGGASDAEQRDDKQKIAILLKLQLGTSQYATMALRELTKGGAGTYKPDYSAR